MINVLLGAGFAQGFNLPGTAEITDHVRGLKEFFVSGDDYKEAPLGSVLWKVASAYYDSPNFETLLHLVECMLSASRSRLGFTLPDSQKVAFNAFMDPTPRLEDVIKAPVIAQFGSAMMSRVATFLDDAISRSSAMKQQVIRQFVDGLTSRDEVRIATLNYDDSIERSVPSFWDGFTTDNPGTVDYASFSQEHALELLHLHGSIRFAAADQLSPKGPVELWRFANSSAVGARRALPSSINVFTQAGELVFAGPMLSGLRKTEKLVIEPYGLYHHRFVDGLLKAGKLMSVGYGGADTYVNSAVVRARRAHGENFRAVYITKLPEKSEPLQAATQQALFLPATHSISFANEFPAFIQRLYDSNLCMEENGMLLIGSGFPLSAEQQERTSRFLG